MLLCRSPTRSPIATETAVSCRTPQASHGTCGTSGVCSPGSTGGTHTPDSERCSRGGQLRKGVVDASFRLDASFHHPGVAGPHRWWAEWWGESDAEGHDPHQRLAVRTSAAPAAELGGIACGCVRAGWLLVWPLSRACLTLPVRSPAPPNPPIFPRPRLCSPPISLSPPFVPLSCRCSQGADDVERVNAAPVHSVRGHTFSKSTLCSALMQ